jgi:hypothetical protein
VTQVDDEFNDDDVMSQVLGVRDHISDQQTLEFWRRYFTE